MNLIDKLTEIFLEFPGIGPRQARRFSYYLLKQNQKDLDKISTLIRDLKQSVARCQKCQRFFPPANNESVCSICQSPNRDHSTLLIVEKDEDFTNFERTGAYNGRYYILGGTLPTLAQNVEKYINSKSLLKELEQNKIKEIIFGLSVTPDGDNTREYLTEVIFAKFPDITISLLGRGLSTGIEIEYADKETLKNALKTKV